MQFSKIAQKVTNYLGHFCMKIYSHELSKYGHTVSEFVVQLFCCSGTNAIKLILSQYNYRQITSIFWCIILDSKWVANLHCQDENDLVLTNKQVSTWKLTEHLKSCIKILPYFYGKISFAVLVPEVVRTFVYISDKHTCRFDMPHSYPNPPLFQAHKTYKQISHGAP